MRELINSRRWRVEGFYRFSTTTMSWKYLSEYRKGEVVWEFDEDYELTCYIDGRLDHKLPYSFFIHNILLIDFSSMLPHFNRYVEQYLVEDSDGDIWLYDMRHEAYTGVWLAIRLLPA